MSDQNQRNKRIVWEFWQALDGDENGASARQSLTEDCQWHGPDPVNDLTGPDGFAAGFWAPLKASFPDLTRQSHVFIGGESNGRVDGSNDGRMWVGGTGYLNGTFVNDYLGIGATGGAVKIRWGEFCRVEGEKIVEIYCLLDLIDLIRQAGLQVLPPSRGVDGLFPPPRAGDGVLHDVQKETVTRHTLAHIRRFIFEGLNSYDQSNLKSMGMADYFHPDVQWYGPGGIGGCRSFKQFEDFHQRHWLHAFPDRQVQDLDALIAEGAYSGGPGWAGVKAKHTGQYLDVAATNRPIDFNGLDFWKLENDQYVENWVFVDMIHLFRQFGIDLLARLT